MVDVFISYKRRMRSRVEVLATRLRDLKLEVWFDAKLEAGVSFDAEITEHVRTARAVIVCWTPDAFRRGGDISGWVRSEASIGRQRNVLAAVFLEPSDLDPPFNLDHVLDLADWQGDSDAPEFRDLVTRISHLCDRPGLGVFPGHSASLDVLQDWARSFPDDPLARGVESQAALAEHDALEREWRDEKARFLEQQAEKERQYSERIASLKARADAASEKLPPVRRAATSTFAAVAAPPRQGAGKFGKRAAAVGAVLALAVVSGLSSGLYADWRQLFSKAMNPDEKPRKAILDLDARPVRGEIEPLLRAQVDATPAASLAGSNVVGLINKRGDEIAQQRLDAERAAQQQLAIAAQAEAGRKEEAARKAEAARIAAEKQQAEEAARKAEAARIAAAKQQAEEAARKADAARIAAEKQQAEEAARKAEAERIATEKQQAEEVAQKAEAARIAAEKQQAEEAAQKAEAARINQKKRQDIAREREEAARRDQDERAKKRGLDIQAAAAARAKAKIEQQKAGSNRPKPASGVTASKGKGASGCGGMSGEGLAACCRSAAIRKYGALTSEGRYYAMNAAYIPAASACVNSKGAALP